MAKSRTKVKRHRLLVYHRLGRRLRVPALVIFMLSVVLYGIAWLVKQGQAADVNQALLDRLWDTRPVLFLQIGTSLLLFLFATFILQTSYIQAGSKTIRVRAGIVPINISYARIKQLRLVQFSAQYPEDRLKGSERSLVEPFQGMTVSAVDLRGLPKPFTPRLLRMLWAKFMFTGDRSAIMFVVADPMVLQQQIQGGLDTRQAKRKAEDRYLDPIERASRRK